MSIFSIGFLLVYLGVLSYIGYWETRKKILPYVAVICWFIGMTLMVTSLIILSNRYMP